MPLIPSTDPSDDFRLLGSVESTTPEEIHTLVEEAHRAEKSWWHTSLLERVSLLREVYDACVLEKESLARSVASEMGMPIRTARDDIGYGLTYFLWYLDNAEKYLSPEVTFESDTEIHTVYYEPKWLIVAITPWNYPFMLFSWACIQALLAGNVVIWKLSKEVILTGKLIGDIFARSRLPKWVWSEVYGDWSTGDLLTDEAIDGITFTGSTAVGNKLSLKALKKDITAVMELGGSAPGIVCADADIDAIVETIYFMRFSNSGQMCDGLKRLIVHASRYDELIEKLRTTLLSKKIGKALDESTDIWPLVSESQRAHLAEQYDDAVMLGADILIELPIPSDLKWAYFPPTVFGNITADMKIWKEETFGPLLPVVTFETIEEAITLANDTEYGLGAYVFTEDTELFSRIAREVESGMVQMNSVNYCIPADPFGGYKSSWIGREHGRWWYHELTNVKVVSRPKK